MRHVLSRWHTERPSHPREASMAVITLVAGLIAFVAGAVPNSHLIAVCLGIGAFLFGLYSQLVSATTGERWLNIIGIGLAFIGVGLGLGHGGFTI